MNKIVVILGAIVLITLGALFFCAGFFTGSTIPSLFSEKTEKTLPQDKDAEGKKISPESVESTIRAKSESISDKILKILSSGTQPEKTSITRPSISNTNISSESLLREIISSHTEHDNCSIQKTESIIQYPTKQNPDSLQGKTIVFIGYFKNNIALQVQKLLTSKGYKIHVEQSKTNTDESYVFCGPFKKLDNAKKLTNWLKQHDFSEAKVIDTTSAHVEDLMLKTSEDSDALPENEEKNIPEINNIQLNALQNEAIRNTQQNFNNMNNAQNYYNQGQYSISNQQGIQNPQQSNIMNQQAPQNMMQQRNLNNINPQLQRQQQIPQQNMIPQNQMNPQMLRQQTMRQ